MAELLQKYAHTVIDDDGTTYMIRTYGEERADGTWTGWLEFHPTDESEPVLRTEQETSQPNLTTLKYWATGLEPIYFDGAFQRARNTTLDRQS